jgi:hypothetical protein
MAKIKSNEMASMAANLGRNGGINNERKKARRIDNKAAISAWHRREASAKRRAALA